ncbi:MAG TPA: hypothetical protein VFQ88_01465 [Nevskiaceae bacterium]|nr:hypothetical protein [Nevskiaceae bacterium]
MDVQISIHRDITVAVSLSEAIAALGQVEAVLRRFPKLAELKAVGADQYHWKMETIGSHIARVAYDAEFRVHTSFDAGTGCLSWQPVAGFGNTELHGSVRAADAHGQTRIEAEVAGRLTRVPVPLLYRPMAAPFIQGKFQFLVEGFLENLRDSLALTAHSAAAGLAR